MNRHAAFEVSAFAVSSRKQATIITLNILQERVSRAGKMTHGRVSLGVAFTSGWGAATKLEGAGEGSQGVGREAWMVVRMGA